MPGRRLQVLLAHGKAVIFLIAERTLGVYGVVVIVAGAIDGAYQLPPTLACDAGIWLTACGLVMAQSSQKSALLAIFPQH